jgi:hypothetical protein
MGKKIPKFRSEEEEAKFWGKNTPLDYSDEFVGQKEPFKFALALLKKASQKQNERKMSLTFRMEESQVVLLKFIAKSIGEEHYQALMRRWIRERILKTLKEDPRVEQEARKQQIHLLHA